jgi:phosphatidylserine/phosphatidylglycerophosphate/cardiolipin synthase-like enzyme
MIEAKIHRVLFGPTDNIEEFIGQELDNAKNSITMMIFWFTWKPLAQKIIEASHRGINIKILLDKRSTEVKLKDVDLANETLIPDFLSGFDNIEVYIYQGELLHHKTILIDEDRVLNGSCNFFNASINRHEENYMSIQSKELKDKFYERFIEIKQNSKRWKK